MALQPPPKHLSRQRRHSAKLAEREQARRDERRDRAEAAVREREAERRHRKAAERLHSSSQTVSSGAIFTISIPRGTDNTAYTGSSWDW